MAATSRRWQGLDLPPNPAEQLDLKLNSQSEAPLENDFHLHLSSFYSAEPLGSRKEKVNNLG